MADDTIDLSGVDANAGAGTPTVQVRLANSGATDMEIVLTGLVNLTATEFAL